MSYHFTYCLMGCSWHQNATVMCETQLWVTIWGKQAEESRTAGAASHFIQRPVVQYAAEVLGIIGYNKDIFGSI